MKSAFSFTILSTLLLTTASPTAAASIQPRQNAKVFVAGLNADGTPAAGYHTECLSANPLSSTTTSWDETSDYFEVSSGLMACGMTISLFCPAKDLSLNGTVVGNVGPDNDYAPGEIGVSRSIARKCGVLDGEREVEGGIYVYVGDEPQYANGLGPV